MFRRLGIILCVFLTSAFNSAWADYCFENSNSKGLMSRFICFQEISILDFGTTKQKIHVRTDDIDETNFINKLVPVGSGFQMTVKGDYLNYAENCGLTIISQYELKAAVNAEGKYVHEANNALTIRYKYTPNSCTKPPASGSEHFVPKI